jgi:hypothetical protein
MQLSTIIMSFDQGHGFYVELLELAPNLWCVRILNEIVGSIEHQESLFALNYQGQLKVGDLVSLDEAAGTAWGEWCKRFVVNHLKGYNDPCPW